MIARICGVYLVVVAVAVAVHTVVEPFYHSNDSAALYGEIWGILDWFMALSIVLGIWFAYQMKSSDADRASSGGITRGLAFSNLLFYGFLYVAILFFWNWFMHLNPGAPSPDGGKVLLVWLIVDAGLPLLAGSLGFHLVRESSAVDSES